jgi:hypothetical protein
MSTLSAVRRTFTFLGSFWLLGHAGIAMAQEQTIRVSTVSCAGCR